jgi:hypothetical protein
VELPLQTAAMAPPAACPRRAGREGREVLLEVDLRKGWPTPIRPGAASFDFKSTVYFAGFACRTAYCLRFAFAFAFTIDLEME